MRSFAPLLLVAQLFAGAIAHKDWVQTLPDCWQRCFSVAADAGCSSSKCVCNKAESSAAYLPDAVTCAVSKCEVDAWAVTLVLGPLQLYCAAVSCPIPDKVISSAYAAASNTAGSSESTRTLSSPSRPTRSAQKTSRDDGPTDPTSTTQTTITRTSVVDGGHTVVVVVPIAVGPGGISTGAISTTTLSEAASASETPSTPASPSPSLAASSPTPTKGAAATSAAARPASGNGTPFGDVVGGAGRWSVPGILLGLGGVAGLLMRL